MEEIIELVIQKLKEREQSTLVLSCQLPFDDSLRGKKDYMCHQKIYLKEADIFFLNKLIEKRMEDPFIKWIYKSYDYACEVAIELSFLDLALIPNALLKQSIMKLYTIDGKRISFFSKRIITYEDVALLNQKDVCVKASSQLITELALEQLQKMQVDIVERGRPL